MSSTQQKPLGITSHPGSERAPEARVRLGGRPGVAWQRGREGLVALGHRTRGTTLPALPEVSCAAWAPGSAPSRGGSGAARVLPRCRGFQGPWPPTPIALARVPARAQLRARRCRTRASCGTSSSGETGPPGLRSSASSLTFLALLPRPTRAPLLSPPPPSPPPRPLSLLAPPGALGPSRDAEQRAQGGSCSVQGRQ